MGARQPLQTGKGAATRDGGSRRESHTAHRWGREVTEGEGRSHWGLKTYQEPSAATYQGEEDHTHCGFKTCWESMEATCQRSDDFSPAVHEHSSWNILTRLSPWLNEVPVSFTCSTKMIERASRSLITEQREVPRALREHLYYLLYLLIKQRCDTPAFKDLNYYRPFLVWNLNVTLSWKLSENTKHTYEIIHKT